MIMTEIGGQLATEGMNGSARLSVFDACHVKARMKPAKEPHEAREPRVGQVGSIQSIRGRIVSEFMGGKKKTKN